MFLRQPRSERIPKCVFLLGERTRRGQFKRRGHTVGVLLAASAARSSSAISFMVNPRTAIGGSNSRILQYDGRQSGCSLQTKASLVAQSQIGFRSFMTRTCGASAAFAILHFLPLPFRLRLECAMSLRFDPRYPKFFAAVATYVSSTWRPKCDRLSVPKFMEAVIHGFRLSGCWGALTFSYRARVRRLSSCARDMAS